MIEQFHHQFKATLKCQPTPTHWTDALPLVLLGIQTALKEDLQCAAAELVHGTTLRLPREFFNCIQEISIIDPTSYVSQLKAIMQDL